MAGGLSKVDAWLLVNVILRLYKVIANCYDLCNLYKDQKVIMLERWEAKDRKISDYFLIPQQYGYGKNGNVQLSDQIFEELYKFIIEEEDFALAIDFIQPKLHLNHIIQTMQSVEEHMGIRFLSFECLVYLSDFRTEIYRWAAVYCSRKNSTIDKEIARREVMTYTLLCDDKRRIGVLREDLGNYRAADINSFDLSSYFIDGYSSQCLSRIYQFLCLLNTQKCVCYIAEMASVIAIAWENHLLCDTYSNTLQAVFNHFGITEKIENYKPARLRRSNYKGNIPLARVQAIKFFHSIDDITLIH